MTELLERYNIYDWMIEGGTDGMVFGIVCYFFKYRAKQEIRWIDKVLANSDSWYLKSLEDSMDWLRENEYNDETIDFLADMWYRRKFGDQKREAYQGAPHNDGKPPRES
jgi:hypothetical protein